MKLRDFMDLSAEEREIKLKEMFSVVSDIAEPKCNDTHDELDKIDERIDDELSKLSITELMGFLHIADEDSQKAANECILSDTDEAFNEAMDNLGLALYKMRLFTQELDKRDVYNMSISDLYDDFKSTMGDIENDKQTRNL